MLAILLGLAAALCAQFSETLSWIDAIYYSAISLTSVWRRGALPDAGRSDMAILPPAAPRLGLRPPCCCCRAWRPSAWPSACSWGRLGCTCAEVCSRWGGLVTRPFEQLVAAGFNLQGAGTWERTAASQRESILVASCARLLTGRVPARWAACWGWAPCWPEPSPTRRPSTASISPP